jgi:hypothetical protein
MKTFAQHQPLTDAELDRLAELFKGCKSGKGMNVKQLDEFFAALQNCLRSMTLSWCARHRIQTSALFSYGCLFD